jgi:hypothetical protein
MLETGIRTVLEYIFFALNLYFLVGTQSREAAEVALNKYLGMDLRVTTSSRTTSS